MNKTIILVILIITVMACAPIPTVQQNGTIETSQETNETVTNETVTNETTSEVAEPDMRDVPTKEVTEGELVNFPNLKAVDPDGDPITYTFTPPLDINGEWQTKEGDAGEHLVTITASDGVNTVSQYLLIVVKTKNKAPTIELEEPIEAKEGTTLVLQPLVTDLDGDQVIVTYSGWMDSDTKEISFGEKGLHEVVITASDGKAVTSKEVTVSVVATNREPLLADITPQTVQEGQKVRVKPSAKDPDGDSLTFTYDFPLDENGTWTPEIGDAGQYEILVTASDGQLTTQKTFLLTVQAINRPPVIELASPVVVKEGDTVMLNPVITDNEGDEVRVTYSGWMNSNTKQTTYEDAGNHKVTITARDSANNEVRAEIIVAVQDLNRPPIFGAGSFN